MKQYSIFRSLIALAILLGVVWSSKKDDPAATPTTPVVTKSTAKDITPLGGI